MSESPYQDLSPEEKVEAMEKELGELRPLKDTSQKLQEEFKQKEDTWTKERVQLEEAANPNWQKARKTMDAMRVALEEKGVKIDNDGNVVSNPQNIDIEKVKQEARDAARGELLGGRLEEILATYDVESGKLVKYNYNKLIAGETVTLQNIQGFINQAEQAARAASGSEIKKKAFTFTGGAGPRSNEETQGKLDDATAQQLGSRMGLGFARAEKK